MSNTVSAAPLLIIASADTARGDTAEAEHGAAEEFAAIMAGLTAAVVPPSKPHNGDALVKSDEAATTASITLLPAANTEAATEQVPATIAVPVKALTSPEATIVAQEVVTAIVRPDGMMESNSLRAVREPDVKPRAAAAIPVLQAMTNDAPQQMPVAELPTPIITMPATEMAKVIMAGVTLSTPAAEVLMPSVLVIEPADEPDVRIIDSVLDETSISKPVADLPVATAPGRDYRDSYAGSNGSEADTAFNHAVTTATDQAWSMLLGEASARATSDTQTEATATPSPAPAVTMTEPPPASAMVRIAGTEFHGASRPLDVPAALPAEPVRVTTTTAEATPNGRVVTVRFTSPDGAASRIRVAVVGETVHATILADAASAAGFERALPELRKSLGERGFNDAQVSVRVVGVDGTVQLRSETATARDTNHRHDERPTSRQRDFAGDDRPRHSRRDRAEEEQA